MERFFYYVMPHGTLWEVRSQGQFDLQLHETQQQAWLAAATSAREKFAASGTPTGVRVKLIGQSWQQFEVAESGELREQPVSI